MSAPLIEVNGLSFRYGQYDHNALNHVSLSIEKGEFIVVTGPSGCGKSTLCRCLNGLIPGSSGGHFEGDVIVCGLRTGDHNAGELAPYVGSVFQEPDNQLFSDTVESEIAFGPENLGLSHADIERRVSWALSTTGAENLRHRLISELSGGEKQRVAISTAMAMCPQALILDEPTSEIDPKGAIELISTLKTLNEKEGLTIVLAEHRIERLLSAMSRLVVMDRGEIAYDGEPSDVFNNDTGRLGVCVPPIVQFSRRFHVPFARSVESLDVCGDWRVDQNGSGPKHGDVAVSFRSVSYRYPSAEADAISDLTLDLYKGEIAVILGANGSGKTTLIKHMNGLYRPYKGDVLIEGKSIKGMTVAANARRVGLVFQNATCQLFEETIAKELAFGPRNIGLQPAEVMRRVEEVAASLALGPIGLSRSPLTLSGGEKQRVAIAGILTLGQEIVALDEPTLGLDHGLKEKLAALVRRLKANDKAVVIVTHDVEFAANCADRAILMSGGRIVADGTAREILTSAMMEKASLRSPQASLIGRRLGIANLLYIEELYRGDR